MSASSGESAPIRLSRRELEVAGLVAQGLTNRDIATRLFLSERTVDGHLEHIREKLGVNSRAQVAAWYVRQGAGEKIPTPETATSAATRPMFVAHPRLWVATALVVALLAAGVGLVRLITPAPPTIETIAGSECSHQIYPGGCFSGDLPDQATRAYLARPTGVALARSGMIYIADSGNNRVRQVAAGVLSTLAGSDSQEQAAPGLLATSVSLGEVSSVAVDVDGRPLVLTRVGGTVGVWKVTTAGFLEQVVAIRPAAPGDGPVGPQMPVGGLAVAKDGTLFIADRNGNRVWKFAGGQLTPYAGTGFFGSPEDGSATSSDLAWPIGLALDSAGDLLIADTGNNRIRMVDPQRRITTIAGSGAFDGDGGDGGPAVRATLRFPYGVAVGPDGSIVIADTGNHRLRIISGRIINPLAGTGQWGFNGDGTALQTMLSGPEGVAFDATGDLFIADTDNQRVREIKALAMPK